MTVLKKEREIERAREGDRERERGEREERGERRENEREIKQIEVLISISLIGN